MKSEPILFAIVVGLLAVMAFLALGWMWFDRKSRQLWLWMVKAVRGV